MEGLTVKTVDLPVTTDNQNPEGGFLAWLLLLGQQYGLPVNIPASDAYRAADRLRQCVAEGHLTGTERWTVLDVAAHIGWCSDAGILPAGWVRSGLEIAHRAFLGSGGSVPTLEPPADYLRAIAVEPGLRAVVRAVDALISMTGPTDQLCSGCVWSEIIKPICTPLIGEAVAIHQNRLKIPASPDLGLWISARIWMRWTTNRQSRNPRSSVGSGPTKHGTRSLIIFWPGWIRLIRPTGTGLVRFGPIPRTRINGPELIKKWRHDHGRADPTGDRFPQCTACVLAEAWPRRQSGRCRAGR